ncbi:MAG TPA: deoxyribonuclease IV [Firmicutes bacterium]|nr:deoxyribonuclease IV [Bacillota bacterium]
MGFLGIHASAAGGVYNAVEEGNALGCRSIQIFTANQRTWKTKEPETEAVKRFIAARKESTIKYVCSHASYLINLASCDPEKLKKSRDAFFREMKRAAALKLDGIVFHPGSFTGGTREKGLKTAAESINKILAKIRNFSSFLLIENTAGSGSTIGRSFEEIEEMIKMVDEKSKVGVCFDTAHAFAAGYDIKNRYDEVFREFDGIIGLKYLKVFHINDSKTEKDSRSDRHEFLGKGKIGEKFFKRLFADKRFVNVPMILETPEPVEDYPRVLRFLPEAA